MTLTIETFFLVFVALGLLIMFGLWHYYDLRDKYRFVAERFRFVFHCTRPGCGKLYYGKPKQEKAPCPDCDKENIRLRFG